MKKQIGKSAPLNWRKYLAGAVALTVVGGLAGSVKAQPLPPLQGPDWQNMTPEQVVPMLEKLPPEQQQMVQQMLQMMSPEQQRAMLQNMPPAQQERFQEMFRQAQMWLRDRIQTQRWNWIRQTLTASGTTDVAVQDAVIAFMQAQEKARQPLRARAQALSTLLVQPQTSTDQFKQQLGEFRETMKKDEERYQRELSALDEKVKFSTQPRLETLLTVLGVVGQETPTLGGVGTLFPDSPMGNLRGVG